MEIEVLCSVMEMAETHRLPFYFVFAAQVYLDKHKLPRGEAVRTLGEMAYQTNVLHNNLQSHLTLVHKSLKIRTWSIANKEVLANKQ